MSLDEKHYANYKKNRYFIEALTIIGNIYGRKLYNKDRYEEDKNYILGIRYVKEYLNSRFNIYVSISQIKRLARPSCKNVHAMKFPTRTFEIFSAVTTLIDELPICSDKCKELKMHYCCTLSQKNVLCRDFIIGDFYKCLSSKRNEYLENSYSLSLLNILDGYVGNCKI